MGAGGTPERLCSLGARPPGPAGIQDDEQLSGFSEILVVAVLGRE
jgi:hypothetical protein